jgi:hypothetical protein
MLQTKSDPSPTMAASNWDARARGLAKLLVLGLVILFLFVADGWFIYRNIVELKGKSFDFYFIWMGTREVGQGRDPYTPEIARQIQFAVTGDTTATTENPYYFSYPAFMTFLVWPFVSFPFPESVTGWVVAQQICLFLALLLALRSLKWRLSAGSVIGVVVAWVAFRYTWIALLLGQTSLLALFFLSAACYASVRHHEKIAGILFAMAMVKPQLVLLTILGWLVKRISERQWRAIGSYGTGVVVLTLLPIGLIGNWIPSFLRGLFLYPIYRPSVTPLSLVASTMPGFSPVIQLAGAALCIGYLLWVASKTRNMMAIASLGVLATLLLIPLASVYDISLALLPWLACLYVLSARRDVASRILVSVLWSLPLVSWLVITILPAALEAMSLPFDVIVCDKLIIPVTLFLIFVYTERKQMWLTAC